MPSQLKIGVEVPKLEQFQRRVKRIESDVIAPPWREGMEAIGVVGQNLAIRAAPIGPSGRTIAKMYHRVQRRAFPLWVKVATNAVAPAPKGRKKVLERQRGSKKMVLRFPIMHNKSTGRSWRYPYPYPRRLNFDPKSKRKGWFDKAMKETKQAAGGVMDATAKKIEAAWRENR